MSENPEIQDRVCAALARLIEQFLERKQIVFELLLEFRPDIFKIYGIDKVIPVLNIDNRIEQLIKSYNKDNYNPDVPINGWHRFFHGHGCKLTHAITKEPLEWDIGHPRSFYIEWFGENLEWRMKNQKDHPDIIICNEWVKKTGESIYSAIGILKDENIITVYDGFGGWFLKKDIQNMGNRSLEEF